MFVDGDLIFFVFNCVGDCAVGGVVFQEVCECFGVGEVVDGDDVEFFLKEVDAVDLSSDPAKAVNSNARFHSGEFI